MMGECQSMVSEESPFQNVVQAMDAAHVIAREYVAGLGTRRVSQDASPVEMARLLDEPLPQEQMDSSAVVAEWLRRAEPGIVASPGPRFFGYVVGGVTPAALAGDWITSAIDQNGGLWAGSPAAAQTELVVLRWLRELFGIPTSWAGVMTTGATMANLVGLGAARQWASERMGFDAATDGLGGHPAIRVAASEAIHASAVKSLGTLGLGRTSLTTVPAPDGRVDLDSLHAALGTIDGPAIVIANAGEVNTGQFDDLEGIADLCADHPGGAWLHVDGAFGLFAAVTPRLRHLLRGIERADSVASDAHKWLNVPYDCGFAFVRDEAALRATFTSRGPYIAATNGWDADDYSPEMSRRFRALSAWCAIKADGRAGYQAMIERCLDHARAFAGWVETTPGFELLNADRMRESPLNVVCFRAIRDELSEDEIDTLNRRLTGAVQKDGRVFVTGTVWQGRTALRAAFDNWATSADDVSLLETTLEELAEQLG